MEYFRSLSGNFRLPDRSLRPLLYGSIAVAAAAGVYYYIQKRGDRARSAEHAHTSLSQDPVQVSGDDCFLDPGLMDDVDGVSVTHTDSTVPAEDRERVTEAFSILKSQYEETLKRHDELIMETEWKQEAHSILKSQYEETLKRYDELIMETERKQEAHSILKSQYQMTLTHFEQTLKDTQSNAQRKYEQTMESNAQLENEKSDLEEQLHSLRGRVWQLEEMLADADIKFGIIQQDRDKILEDYKILKTKYEKMIKQHEESKIEHERERESKNGLKSLSNQLKVSLIDVMEKHEQAMASNAQLEHQNSNLMDKVSILRDSVQRLKEELFNISRTYDRMTWECEQEQHDWMTKEEFLKVTLSKTERKYDQAMESNAQLEKEKLDLMYHLHKLGGSVGAAEVNVVS